MLMEERIEKLNIEKEGISSEETIKEIDRLIEADKELREKGEPADSTLLASVRRKDLAEEDTIIFQKCLAKAWSLPEWQVYTDKVSKHMTENPKDKTNNSRDIFRDWLAKKAYLQFEKERSEGERQKDN